MFSSKMCLNYLIFFLFFIPADLINSLPLSPELTIPPDYPIWLAIERVLPSPEGEGDAILIRPELCNRSCAELIGSGAEQIPRARCVCRCPPGQPVFVQQQKMRGQCSQRIEDCSGRSIFFENSQNARPQFVPSISLPQSGEPIGEELRIAWKESGVKVRQSQGPRCSIKSAKLLGKNSEWKTLEAQKLFEPGWTEGNGRILWIGSDSDAQQLAGGIINIGLECVAGKNGNSTFCISYRVEGQIEAAGGVGKAPPGQIGIELERGRRAEVVVIILLAILLFLSLFGSIFIWNVCWRMHKRKLVHSLQMQFVHFARQEKEKAISECQLRYQALVKAAAGIRNAEEGQSSNVGYTNNNNVGIGPSNLMENGDEIMQMQGGQQQQNGRRKLYFSSDFFEPKLMSSPPPMAEQFLYDLRKMITCARERIRTRRHVPRLPPVVESEDEGPGIGGNVVGKLAKSEEIVAEKEEMKIQSNEEEKPKMDEKKEEENGKRTSEEMEFRIEEIGPKEERKEEIHRRENVKEEGEEKEPSPRSSMDSGRGSEKREEEEEEMDEQKPKEENGMEEEIAKEEHKNEEKNEEKLKSANKVKNRNEEEGKMVNNELADEPNGDQTLANGTIQQPTSRIPVGTASTSQNNNKSTSRLQFTAFCRRAPPLPPRPPPPPPSDAAEGKMMELAIEGKPKGHQNPVAAMKRRIASSNNNERNETTKPQQPSSIPVGNSYAICPPPSFACTDRMKKSLPRRKKAIVPITTNSTATVLPKATPTVV